MKNEEIKSLKKIKGSENNPFMLELKGKMYLQPRANTIIAKGQEIINTETGEVIQDNVLLGRRKIVDKSEFAKIYASEVGLILDLSKCAINVLIYICKIMDFEQKALFNYVQDYKKLGYKTHLPVLNGIRELITKNIIYPHTINGVWWINPTIICKGERFAKYTEYVTVERAEQEKKEMLKKQIENKMNILPDEVNAMNAEIEDRYFNGEEIAEINGNR